MMIEVPDDLFRRLQRLAVPLVDTPQTVLERAVKALEADSQGSQTALEMRPAVELRAGDSTEATAYAFTKPHLVRLRGTEHSVWNWKDVLPLVAGELFKADKNRFVEAAKKFAGRKKEYIAASTKGMESPRKIPGSNLHIETNFSADHTVQRCRELLRLNGGASDDFAVLTSPR